MDEVARTIATYEEDAGRFVEKYRAGSVAELLGDDFFAVLSGDRVLDVGCGPGPDAETFADEGYDVVGLDRTPPFLRSAREAVPDGSFVRGDMRRLPFRDAVFDGLWSCASLLHVPRADAPAALREFRRVLDDGGVAFLTMKLGDDAGFDEDGRYFERYRPEELRSLLADAGFEVRSLSADETWIQVLGSV